MKKPPQNPLEQLINQAEQLYDQKKYQEAVECLNRVIQLDSNYAVAYYNKGYCLNELQRYGEAIECYNRAIELDPADAFAYSNKGASLNELKRYEEAIKCFDYSIELTPGSAEAYNNKGTSFKYLKRYDEALVCYNKAIILDANELLPLRNRALLKEEMYHFEEALADYKEYINRKPDDSYVSFLYKQLQEKMEKRSTNISGPLAIAKAVVSQLYAEKTPHTNIDISKTFNGVVPIEELELLMNKLYKDNKEHRELEQRVERRKPEFRQFTSSGRTPEIDQPEFHVLQRWNSYTPIIADDNSKSKGGGYFIHLGEEGIVIDPGFNFIQNFKNHGFKFSQISKIFITHSHNDHMTDLESLQTLLYLCNKDFKKDIDEELIKKVLEISFPNQENMSEEELYKAVKIEGEELYKNNRKVIEFYLTASTFKKFGPNLSLSEKSDYRLILVSAHMENASFECGGKSKFSVNIRPVVAKHADLFSDCDAIGLAIEFPQFKSALIYTGDTRFTWDIGNKYYELGNEYRDKHWDIALLAHIGGFQEREHDRSRDRIIKGTAFYDNHLGRNGLICLTAHLKPTFCILSEFGEEFRGDRETLASQFAKVFDDSIPFIPADIGLCMRADGKFWVANSYAYDKIECKFIDAAAVRTFASLDATELIYYSKEIEAAFIGKDRWEIESSLKKDTSRFSIRPNKHKS